MLQFQNQIVEISGDSNAKKMDESIFIKNCQRGNLEDFSPLYEKYAQKIFAFVLHKTFDRETAEDLTSQIFLKTLEKIESYNFQKSQFSTWLYSIARNCVIDHFRTQHFEKNIDDIWDLNSGDDARKCAEKSLNFESLQKSMKKLKPAQREILTMRFWQDLSYAEIAEITDQSEANVRMIVSRSVRAMKKDFLAFLLFSLIF
ncbi:sigma-70 family RNA polymerase sigma factor [bacterium]|nr:sigma-70 family RNA polymerase sigma factor [bacterium]MBT7772429.1 sigma-70 family RNA polymerase sigma factor [bacterium]